MNRRIEEIRRDVGLSQEAFGERLNVSMNYVWMIENGKRIPSERLIKSICREFGVNEEWLRTGEGEMLSPSEEFDLAEYAKSKGATDLELRIVKAYFALPEDVRRAVMQSLSETFRDAFPAPVAAPRNVHDWTPDEMRAELERISNADGRRQAAGIRTLLDAYKDADGAGRNILLKAVVDVIMYDKPKGAAPDGFDIEIFLR